MAFFAIRSRRVGSAKDEREDLEATVKYLGLTKIDETTYRLANGNLLKLFHDQTGYALEPPQQ